MVRVLIRLLHVGWVLAIVFFMVVPVLPDEVAGKLPGKVATLERHVSIKEGWQMYAPNPQRAQPYMNLEADYPDGTTRQLEETEQEQQGWGTHWAGNKTRLDIWRMYASFNPKKGNRNRVWYLKAVCVREARRGPIPQKIVMNLVSRRFAPPRKVREGYPGLGRPRRKFVTVQYCKTAQVLQMIEEDRERRGVTDRG